MYATVTSHMLIIQFCSLVPVRTVSWEQDRNYHAAMPTISIDSAQEATVQITKSKLGGETNFNE